MPYPNEADGPERDPLDVAAENAARRLLSGEEMDRIDWEALHAKAASELREYDLKHNDF